MVSHYLKSIPNHLGECSNCNIFSFSLYLQTNKKKIQTKISLTENSLNINQNLTAPSHKIIDLTLALPIGTVKLESSTSAEIGKDSP
jgi:hypothetical protein